MRTKAYGQDYKPTLVDKLGVWLSLIKIRKAAIAGGGQMLDLGAGYQMSLSAQMIGKYDITAVDIALNQNIFPQIVKIEGSLEHVLPMLQENGYDFVLFNSVLEHLAEPQNAMDCIFRLLKPGGVMFLNVPTWMGKWFLEFSAFRLGTSPASEMNDHKMYYDKRTLWPILVKAGFLPQEIHLHYHKFGLNVYAVCKKVQ